MLILKITPPYRYAPLTISQRKCETDLRKLVEKRRRKDLFPYSKLPNSSQLLSNTDVKCDLVYFPENTWQKLSKSQLAEISKATLTIGSNREFLKNGGVLSLILVDNKMKIFISHKALS